MYSLGSLNSLCCSNTNLSLMHMFSPSGLVPKLPDDLGGISPIAGLRNGGKYTKLGILLGKNRGSRQQTVRALRPGAWD